MKGETIAKKLKQGHTLYYIWLNWMPSVHAWEVGKIIVGSDKMPAPPEGEIVSTLPRWYVRGCIADRAVLDFCTLSRRKAHTKAKLLNAMHRNA